MTYQLGTEFIAIEGRRYALRLTMGALAEISDRFEASGPMELAARLRCMKLSDARELLACLLRPSLPLGVDGGRLAAQISPLDLQKVLPKMCRIIEQAFGEVS